MRYFVLIFCSFVLSASAFAQANFNVTDPDIEFKKAKEFFIKEQYALAYPLLKELKLQYPESNASSYTTTYQDVSYYYLVTELALNQDVAEDEAKTFIASANNEARQQVMSYHLARYYFLKKNYNDAIVYYERAKYDNLSNEEIANAKFELAYSYFVNHNNEKAKPLFNEIHQLSGNKYYAAANYYYGLISFAEKNTAEALQSFKRIENDKEYRNVVPYYIAEIYYSQGNKEEALRYAETALGRGETEHKTELQLLAGQIYFEQKKFASALPYLEAYIKSTGKVSKEVMYELSYSYYDANRVEDAIAGFKELSNGTDSLAQNSMYLLGDLYLKTGQKENARNAFLFSSGNSSNRTQQEISKFNYAKLSYELGYQDVALTQMRRFTEQYPSSVYQNEAKEILVDLLANTNNFSEALNIYRSVAKPTASMQKVYPKILYGRGTELLTDQNLDAADELFAKVIADPNAGKLSSLGSFWRGEIANRKGQYDASVNYMNAYLQNPLTQGEANVQTAKYVTGYSYLKKENYQQAINFLEPLAGNISPQSSALEQDAYIRTADSYFMLRNFTKANSMYETVLNRSLPQSDYALYQKAMIAGINTPAEKIKLLTSLITQYPNSDLNPDANLEIGNTYMAQERFKDALPYLSKVIEGTSSLRPKAYLQAGLAYFNLDNNTAALDNYQKLIASYPQSPEADQALDNMKAIYVEEGRPNEYVEVLRRAGKTISVSEADKLTYSAAELKYSNGDCGSAITAFTNYLTQYPEGAYAIQANYFRSECQVKTKDFKNAVAGYQYVVSKGGKYAERAALQVAKISYLELQDYNNAKLYFLKLREIATTNENQLEALRGLVRSYYQTKDFTEATNVSKELLTKKGLSTDDKSIANLVLGKSLQESNQCEQAITAFKAVSAINKSAWGAESRYETANCYLKMNNLTSAEKAAMEVIKVTGSYDYWVAKSYILLGDVYMAKKDFFNAKAMYQSVASNATIPEIKTEAQQKLEKAIAEEKLNSRVQQN